MDYQVYSHLAVTRPVSVDEATLRSIQAGEAPITASDTIRAARRFTHQLVKAHGVQGEVNEQAKVAFDEKGQLDMIKLVDSIWRHLNCRMRPVSLRPNETVKRRGFLRRAAPPLPACFTGPRVVDAGRLTLASWRNL